MSSERPVGLTTFQWTLDAWLPVIQAWHHALGMGWVSCNRESRNRFLSEWCAQQRPNEIVPPYLSMDEAELRLIFMSPCDSTFWSLKDWVPVICAWDESNWRPEDINPFLVQWCSTHRPGEAAPDSAAMINALQYPEISGLIKLYKCLGEERWYLHQELTRDGSRHRNSEPPSSLPTDWAPIARAIEIVARAVGPLAASTTTAPASTARHETTTNATATMEADSTKAPNPSENTQQESEIRREIERTSTIVDLTTTVESTTNKTTTNNNRSYLSKKRTCSRAHLVQPSPSQPPSKRRGISRGEVIEILDDEDDEEMDYGSDDDSVFSRDTRELLARIKTNLGMNEKEESQRKKLRNANARAKTETESSDAAGPSRNDPVGGTLEQAKESQQNPEERESNRPDITTKQEVSEEEEDGEGEEKKMEYKATTAAADGARTVATAYAQRTEGFSNGCSNITSSIIGADDMDQQAYRSAYSDGLVMEPRQCAELRVQQRNPNSNCSLSERARANCERSTRDGKTQNGNEYRQLELYQKNIVSAGSTAAAATNCGAVHAGPFPAVKRKESADASDIHNSNDGSINNSNDAVDEKSTPLTNAIIAKTEEDDMSNDVSVKNDNDVAEANCASLTNATTAKAEEDDNSNDGSIRNKDAVVEANSTPLTSAAMVKREEEIDRDHYNDNEYNSNAIPHLASAATVSAVSAPEAVQQQPTQHREAIDISPDQDDLPGDDDKMLHIPWRVERLEKSLLSKPKRLRTLSDRVARLEGLLGTTQTVNATFYQRLEALDKKVGLHFISAWKLWAKK